MPQVRTVYVPRFSSQLSSSQRDEPQPPQTPDQAEPPTLSQRHKRGNKRVRGQTTRCLLKVKIPKLNNSTLSKVTKEIKTPKRWTAEPPANKTKTTVSQEGAGADSESVGRDIFSFSQRPTSTPKTEKERAKFAVLRTISRMLEENQLIRQRLAAFSKDSLGCSD